MNSRDSLSDSRPGPACAAFAPLLPLVSHHLLEPEEAQRLEAHVADCAHCEARLAAYDRLDGALRQRFGQVVGPLLQSEDIVKHIEDQEKAGADALPAVTLVAETPVSLLRQRRRPRRAISWVGAIAAVLLIALVTTALVASRHPLATGQNTANTSTTPGLPSVAPASGVYFSAETAGPPAHTFLYALNPTDGSVRWHIPMPTGPSITITPVQVDHYVLYVLEQDLGTASPTKGATPQTRGASATINAVSAFQTSNGKGIWHTPLANVPMSFLEADGVLYIGTNNGGLYALNASDGAVRWHINTGAILDDMQVVDGLIYGGVYHSIGNNVMTGDLVALNTSDGSVKWRFPLQGDAETIQVSNGRLAVVDTQVTSDQNNGVKIRQWLSVLNASTGAVEWRYAGDPSTLGSSFLEQDSVYVTVLAGPGKEAPAIGLQALDASNGSVRWQKSYAITSLLRPDQGLAGGKVYLTTQDNTLYALNAQDGSEAWHVNLGAGTFLQRQVGGMLYVSAPTAVYGLNAANGAKLWQYHMGDGGYIVSADSRAVYGINKPTSAQDHWVQQLFAINASTGNLLWHYDTTSPMVILMIG